MASRASKTIAIIALIAGLCSLAFGPAKADGTDWLIGHWDGHDTKNLGDKRHFALDIAGVRADQSFVAQWTIDAKASSGQGKINANAITIAFPNGNILSLFRGSDGSLAGNTSPKDGSPGITLVFAKGGAAVLGSAAGSDKTCPYHAPARQGLGPLFHAKDGDVVVTRDGQRKCVSGRLIPVN